MPYERVKELSRSLGLYPLARWANRYVVNRATLYHYRDELRFYSQFLAPGDLCFDVGANYGLKTEVFLNLGAKVIAFEPQADCLEELQSRLRDRPALVTVNAAVGSREGVATFYVNPARTASSFVNNWQGEAERSVEVSVTTLDHAIAAHGLPKYCKIDVEGFEIEVLRGLSQPIPLISYEFHQRLDGLDKALECLETLSRLGEIQVNLTPTEKPDFASPEWWTKDAFIEFFRREVPGSDEFAYGDIFVKTEPRQP